MNTHQYKAINDSFDANCIRCEGKKRDAIHLTPKTHNFSRRYFPEGYETSNGQIIEDKGWYILACGMWMFDDGSEQ